MNAKRGGKLAECKSYTHDRVTSSPTVTYFPPLRDRWGEIDAPQKGEEDGDGRWMMRSV
jgi:hypothetical protein